MRRKQRPDRERRPKRATARSLDANVEGAAVPCAILGMLLAPSSASAGITLPILSGDVTGEQDLTGLILLILLLFGTFTAVLHLVGRRDWTRRRQISP